MTPWRVSGCAVALMASVTSGCTTEPSCPPQVEIENVPLAVTSDVDLLFVIDDSGSIVEDQESLVFQIPRIVDALTSGDLDPSDGIVRGQDFPPVETLQLGVVSTDMGTGGFRLPGCVNAEIGDDGVLSASGDWMRAGCLESYPSPIVSFPFAGSEEVATTASCLVAMGMGGCGWEQPLEAALKAITPSTQAPVGSFDGRFLTGSGHADGDNAGFLRPSSILAIVVLTNELDCSVSDPRVFDPDGGELMSDNVFSRCFLAPGVLHRTGRYVDGFLAQRSSPELLVFAAIAGIPPDSAAPPGAQTPYASILAHPDMQLEMDTEIPSRPRPSCNSPGTNDAFPPRRLVEVASLLNDRGAAGVIQSICQSALRDPVDAVIHAIGDALRPTCVEEREVVDGRVDCNLVETLPDGMSCSSFSGYTQTGIDTATGRERCQVVQAGVLGGEPLGTSGWYYDDFSPETRDGCGAGGQRIVFLPGSEPPVGAHVLLECTIGRCESDSSDG